LTGDGGPLDPAEKKHLTEFEIRNNWRLACKVRIIEDITIEIPGVHGGTDRKKDLIMFPEGFSPDLWPLDKNNKKVYGVAFDIGTTTVVGMLWDLTTGKPVHAAARTNPQSVFGADVISRIMFSGQEEGNLSLLQQKVLDCLHEILIEFENTEGVAPSHILKATVVGNTTMSHLFLGINPGSLARSPFEPAFRGPVTVNAEKLGFAINSRGLVHVLPNIAGHVGSDITGVLLASGLRALDGANLAIDIGTNGEILLSYNDKVLTCSTAAGPAFEGASIHQGMRATTGAIESVRIQNGDVELSVIDDATPIGICGSGLIDSAAEMLTYGIITKKGRMLNKEEARKIGLADGIINRLSTGNNGNEFILFKGKGGNNIAINQKDIREVQLAKGAISSGISIMMDRLGIKAEDLRQVLLAGAFGNYINKGSALTIGLLPRISEEKVISIGNAAGVGACMALLSQSAKGHANLLAEETEHVDLAAHPDFQDTYLKAMYF
ncbi:MAG: ASKHA domain-containing protein, partial [Eubacteriales bacterium]|nr:ASKHA domain-containing protein [Eubacteriales bacterium]